MEWWIGTKKSVLSRYRLPNGMSPLIILRGGKPVLGSAATGGGLHAKTLLVLFNILDFRMDPQTAVDTPAFVGWNPPAFEEGTFDPSILEGLKTFGMKAVPEKDAGLLGWRSDRFGNGLHERTCQFGYGRRSRRILEAVRQCSGASVRLANPRPFEIRWITVS
jgi:hypothetical protein